MLPVRHSGVVTPATRSKGPRLDEARLAEVFSPLSADPPRKGFAEIKNNGETKTEFNTLAKNRFVRDLARDNYLAFS